MVLLFFLVIYGIVGFFSKLWYCLFFLVIYGIVCFLVIYGIVCFF